MCAAVGRASHQHGLEACTVCGDRTVCSCRHSKSSAQVRSMYCVWRPYCVQLQAQQVISVGQKHVLCIQTVLCAAVGTASHQHGLEACTVCGDRTVRSCRHSKSSAWVRSMYCVYGQYCVQLQAQQVISMGQKHVLCVETVLCAAVGTASHQHGLEACTVCGDRTVRSCRHSKLSAWVRSMYWSWRPYCVQLQAQQVISVGWKHVLFIQTLLCAGCRHSKSSAWVRSMYCVWRPYCVQLQAQQVISMVQKHVLRMEGVLCAAVGTANHQHGSEAGTVYTDRTVYSCRHSKSSAWVRSRFCLYRPYRVQLQARQVISMGQMHVLCIQAVLCTAVGTVSHQHGLDACTVYIDRTVYSCRHSMSSVLVRSIYCVYRPYCLQLQAQQIISMCQKHILCIQTLLCAAVGTANHQHVLEAYIVYTDHTVCSCRHSKSSAWVRSRYCLYRPYCVQLQAQQFILPASLN